MGDVNAAWDQQTELQAATVDALYSIMAGLAGDKDLFKPVQRPFKTETEPEKTVSLSEFKTLVEGF